MAGRICTYIFTIATLLAQSRAQCPNTLAVHNPNIRTMTGNLSRFYLQIGCTACSQPNVAWFLTPVPKQKVLKALEEAYPSNILFKQLTLLDLSSIPGVPSELFAGDMHPILTVGGLNADIRQSALQISGPLLTASTMVPFVSYKNSKTLMNAPLNGYIGGENRGTLIDRLRLAGLIPALVSSLVGGIELRVGDFLPANAAYQCDGNGECFENSKWVILPNEISGPGVYPEAVDTAFRERSGSHYPLSFWETVINQPIILKGILAGQCQRNTYFFNESTAEVQYRSGEVTFGASSSGFGITRGTLQGKYTGLQGMSACAQNVGFMPEKCGDL
ncbi:hypothetical protein OPT61_g5538 [Boeremia exigua]|uniref:Uncharacterized protein n=1 Tax=Boeremia exigua TaxID=749465 RepID=A0ACC2IA21_9PLEO|nr:hypothetical protein OPT61_g5538 [Boeremia exigua]